jgi:hypothetical protein
VTLCPGSITTTGAVLLGVGVVDVGGWDVVGVGVGVGVGFGRGWSARRAVVTVVDGAGGGGVVLGVVLEMLGSAGAAAPELQAVAANRTATAPITRARRVTGPRYKAGSHVPR